MDDAPRTEPSAGQVTASVALPERHESSATAALRGCLQQRALDRQSDRATAGRFMLDWLTLRVSGPDHCEIPDRGTWFIYTATADLRVFDP